MLYNSFMVNLVKLILERKRERENGWMENLVGRGGRRENWSEPGVFSSGLPKPNLPKLERLQERKQGGFAPCCFWTNIPQHIRLGCFGPFRFFFLWVFFWTFPSSFFPSFFFFFFFLVGAHMFIFSSFFVGFFFFRKKFWVNFLYLFFLFFHFIFFYFFHFIEVPIYTQIFFFKYIMCYFLFYLKGT